MKPAVSRISIGRWLLPGGRSRLQVFCPDFYGQNPVPCHARMRQIRDRQAILCLPWQQVLAKPVLS
jgi:hypothetical protein